MIHSGDMFSVKDLRQSVAEVVTSDTGLCAESNNVHMVIGDTAFDMFKITPMQYAQYRIDEFLDIKSSAINLDNQLRKAGFKTTRRFSHKYNTPGLNSDEIIRDAYCLEYFQTLSKTAMPKPGYEMRFVEMFEDAFRVSYYYAQYLWACNMLECGPVARKLVCPGFENWGQIIGAILGVGLQFHPDDVYEFSINHINPNNTLNAQKERYKQQSEFKDLMKNKYGIDTGCLVLSPISQEKLIKIVTKADVSYWSQMLNKLLRGKKR